MHLKMRDICNDLVNRSQRQWPLLFESGGKFTGLYSSYLLRNYIVANG